METATLPTEEVTIKPYVLEPDVLLDAMAVCNEATVARIAEAARFGDLVYEKPYVFWLCSQAPPLTIVGVASHDPRTRNALTCERFVAA